jgi:Zn finger protein HypA/HybF involved in hydrogenase expression
MLNGPEMLMQDLHQLTTVGKQVGELKFIKVLRTFIINTELKAEISTEGTSANKVIGVVDWIGERKDGQKGVELFLRSRSGNKVFVFGENDETALFNGQKNSLTISEAAETCLICKSVISAKDVVIQCPSCGVRAHKDHFLEYLKIHGTCPKCNKRLTMKAQAPPQ